MRHLLTAAVIGLLLAFTTSAVAEPLATAPVAKKKKCFKKKRGKKVRVKCRKPKKKTQAPTTQTPTGQTPATQAPTTPTAPTTPASDPVRERFLFLMSGEMLRFFANGSDPGGIQAESTIHFCSNKSYSYFGQSVISAGGASGTDQTQESGTWDVVRTELSQAQDEILGIIRLAPAGGTPYDIQINLVDNGDGSITTYLNGTRWFRVASDACS